MSICLILARYSIHYLLQSSKHPNKLGSVINSSGFLFQMKELGPRGWIICLRLDSLDMTALALQQGLDPPSAGLTPLLHPVPSLRVFVLQCPTYKQTSCSHLFSYFSTPTIHLQPIFSFVLLAVYLGQTLSAFGAQVSSSDKLRGWVSRLLIFRPILKC